MCLVWGSSSFHPFAEQKEPQLVAWRIGYVDFADLDFTHNVDVDFINFADFNLANLDFVDFDFAKFYLADLDSAHPNQCPPVIFSSADKWPFNETSIKLQLNLNENSMKIP